MTLLPLHRLLLRQLDEAPLGEATQDELAFPVVLHQEPVHKALLALEKAGLVRPLDGHTWTLTPAGRATVEAQREHERFTRAPGQGER